MAHNQNRPITRDESYRRSGRADVMQGRLQGKPKRRYRETDTVTIHAGKGARNIEGPRSKRAGMPITQYYPHEKTLYPSYEEAVAAAKETQRLNLADVASGEAVFETNYGLIDQDIIYERYRQE